MRTIKKNVFYCDHCRKHGLSRAAMEKHERHCTLNPGRTCRWVIDGEYHSFEDAFDLARIVNAIREAVPLNETTIDWLRIVTTGCPACMLAALRQSGVEYHYPPGAQGPIFDYVKEVERFREDERNEWDSEERRQIEATFL